MSLHPLQESGEVAKQSFDCVMNSHRRCDGLVSGGRRQGCRCQCECHQPGWKPKPKRPTTKAYVAQGGLRALVREAICSHADVEDQIDAVVKIVEHALLESESGTSPEYGSTSTADVDVREGKETP